MLAACALTGLTRETISAAKAAGAGEGVFKANGTIDCDALVSWLATRPDVLEQSGGLVNYNVERALLMHAKRKREELELAKAAGEYVRIEAVKRDIARHVTSAKTRLLAIPSSAAPVLAGLLNPMEIEAKLKQFVNDAIDELAGIVK